jgi:BMFP domain-containing protein YqiC
MDATTASARQESRTASMIDLSQLDDLARRLGGLVPSSLRQPLSGEAREELQQNFKAVLQAGLGKLDLVTREEFDVQRAVLLRTREQLEALQRAVAALEATRAGTTPTDPQR